MPSVQQAPVTGASVVVVVVEVDVEVEVEVEVDVEVEVEVEVEVDVEVDVEVEVEVEVEVDVEVEVEVDVEVEVEVDVVTSPQQEASPLHGDVSPHRHSNCLGSRTNAKPLPLSHVHPPNVVRQKSMSS